jgi:hypothetical protein
MRFTRGGEEPPVPAGFREAHLRANWGPPA